MTTEGKKIFGTFFLSKKNTTSREQQRWCSSAPPILFPCAGARWPTPPVNTGQKWANWGVVLNPNLRLFCCKDLVNCKSYPNRCQWFTTKHLFCTASSIRSMDSLLKSSKSNFGKMVWSGPLFFGCLKHLLALLFTMTSVKLHVSCSFAGAWETELAHQLKYLQRGSSWKEPVYVLLIISWTWKPQAC